MYMPVHIAFICAVYIFQMFAVCTCCIFSAKEIAFTVERYMYCAVCAYSMHYISGVFCMCNVHIMFAFADNMHINLMTKRKLKNQVCL
jgi:hypothetical protein